MPVLVLNSAVNPLAYACFKRDIKKEFKRLVGAIFLKKIAIKLTKGDLTLRASLILVGCRSYMNECERLELRLINL